MHYQFEAIHPFIDGNGRTGRILNLLYLVDKGLLEIPVLYLSRYIIGNKRAYYDRLLRVTTDGAWEDWILYMLEGIHDTAEWSNRSLGRLDPLHARGHTRYRGMVKQEDPRHPRPPRRNRGQGPSRTAGQSGELTRDKGPDS
jgi:hypothetical protein